MGEDPSRTSISYYDSTITAQEVSGLLGQKGLLVTNRHLYDGKEAL